MAEVRLMTALAILSAVAATAQSADKTAAAAAEGAGDREKIGEVLGKPVYRDQIRTGKGRKLKSEVHRLFRVPVEKQYFEKHRKELEPTPEEIEKTAIYFRRQFDERALNRPEVAITRTDDKIRELTRIEAQLDSATLSAGERRLLERRRDELEREVAGYVRFFAKFMLRSWKLRVHLYENYGGGRLLWQQAGVEAFDAMHEWLKDQERRGEFQITDPALRAILYRYWTTQKHPFLIEPNGPGFRLALLPPWQRPVDLEPDGEPAKTPGGKPAPEEARAPGADDQASKPKPIDRLNEKGFSKLHLAAMRGDAKAARELLEAGASSDVRQGTYRGTPLQYAAAQGHLKVVHVLLKHDATVDATDANHRTPLMWAAMSGRTEVAKALLDAEADVGAANHGGWTPLHYAVSKGHQGTAQLLINHGAPIHVRNNLSKAPLDLNPALELRIPDSEPQSRPDSGAEPVRARRAPDERQPGDPPCPPRTAKVFGRVVSTEYRNMGGTIERSIVYVARHPDNQRIGSSLSRKGEFEFQLKPGRYRLRCSANGSRGATFEVTAKQFTVGQREEELDLGVIDLPISRTTSLYGKPAPGLAGIVAWKDTEPIALEDLRGKVVVLDFFSYSCGLCHAHKPDLVRLRQKYRDDGLEVIALHSNSVKTFRELKEKMDPIFARVFGGEMPELPIGLEGPGESAVFTAYGITGVPAVILIDQQGRVVRRFHHAGKPELEEEIRRLLKKAAAADWG